MTDVPEVPGMPPEHELAEREARVRANEASYRRVHEHSLALAESACLIGGPWSCLNLGVVETSFGEVAPCEGCRESLSIAWRTELGLGGTP